MLENTKDPRLILLSSINIAKSRVEFSDTPIVLLCGGVVDIKNHPDDLEPPIKSLRHAITKANTGYEIFRPEEITSWHSDGVFKNLMDFEADLASICSLVVIVLESAGSLVELGAFSQLPDLSKKIIAVCSGDFISHSSFINLGILRYIAQSYQSRVKNYPWDINNPHNISPEVIADVISDISEELSKQKKSELLQPVQSSHVIVLICDIIKLFTALKELEILEYLKLVGVQINKDELRSKLFLLEEFRFIKKETYSDASFYIRSEQPYHRLRISLSDNEAFDALRIQMSCIDYYNNNTTKHRNRIRAIAQSKRRLMK